VEEILAPRPPLPTPPCICFPSNCCTPAWPPLPLEMAGGGRTFSANQLRQRRDSGLEEGKKACWTTRRRRRNGGRGREELGVGRKFHKGCFEQIPARHFLWDGGSIRTKLKNCPDLVNRQHPTSLSHPARPRTRPSFLFPPAMPRPPTPTPAATTAGTCRIRHHRRPVKLPRLSSATFPAATMDARARTHGYAKP
jgi:hypothetical protein